jgi:hypothetical protein
MPDAVFSTKGEAANPVSSSAASAARSASGERSLMRTSGQRARAWLAEKPGTTPAARAAVVACNTGERVAFSASKITGCSRSSGVCRNAA